MQNHSKSLRANNQANYTKKGNDFDETSSKVYDKKKDDHFSL